MEAAEPILRGRHPKGGRFRVRAGREVAGLWLARAFLCAGDSPRQIDAEIPDREIRAALDLIGYGPLDGEFPRIRPAAFRRRLRVRAGELAAIPANRGFTGWRSVNLLGDQFGLDEVEREVMVLALMCRLHRGLREILDHYIGTLALRQAVEFLLGVVAIDQAKLSAALAPDAPLVQTRLVRTRPAEFDSATCSIELLEGLETALQQDYDDPSCLMSFFFSRVSPSALRDDDFPHLRVDLAMLRAYVGEARLGAYHVTQRLLQGNQNALVLFDECEDVFPVDVFPALGMRRRSGTLKGFTVKVLEQNPVPAIWITNQVEQMDPAFLRRFTYHLEVPRPTRAVRRRILRKYFGPGVVRPVFIERISESDMLTPADIETAARFAEIVAGTDPVAAEEAVERMLKNRLAARGESLSVPAPGPAAGGYRIEYLNADCDLCALAAALERRPSGTVLLFGPPGTGKTAFARHLSDRTGRPLLVKRASEILSMWVGGTERNIAAMFREAGAGGALLLVDEADSFLQDRRGALRGWEVTQVNEMLTQMEAYDGLFVCSTNLVDDLDQASFRRFGIKVEFGYMRPAQAWEMFVRENGGDAGTPPADALCLRPALERLGNLTPGDFATVRRRLALLSRAATPREHLEMLEAECRAKHDGETRRAVGF